MTQVFGAKWIKAGKNDSSISCFDRGKGRRRHMKVGEDRLPLVPTPSPSQRLLSAKWIALMHFRSCSNWNLARLSYHLAFDVFDRLDCDYYITKSGRKIYWNGNLGKIDREMNEINRKIKLILILWRWKFVYIYIIDRDIFHFDLRFLENRLFHF